MRPGDQFYRWVWDHEDGYTSNLTHDHGDGYLRHLARRECSNAHKNACRKGVMMLYNWRHHQRGAEPWEPEIWFSRKNQSTAPRDYLTREERAKVRDASLKYGSVPSRENVRGDERDRWVAYLAAAFDDLRDVARRDESEQMILDRIDATLQQAL